MTDSFGASQAQRNLIHTGYGGAETNPATGVKQFEALSRERFLTPQETLRLKVVIEDGSNTQLKYIVVLAILSGCRKCELLDARWEGLLAAVEASADATGTYWGCKWDI